MFLIKMKSTGRWTMVVDSKWCCSERLMRAVNTVQWYCTGSSSYWDHIVYTMEDPPNEQN